MMAGPSPRVQKRREALLAYLKLYYLGAGRKLVVHDVWQEIVMRAWRMSGTASVRHILIDDLDALAAQGLLKRVGVGAREFTLP